MLIEKHQEKLMKYDPVKGELFPYPSNADDYRKYHGVIAWLYNPWNGEKRDLRDVGTDVQGNLIIAGNP